MINANASAAFRIRSTFPGQHSGLKEWSQDELAMFIASYQECYPEQWQTYLEAERDRGFITNAMNDHIMAHIAQTVPGLHSKHYRVGAVDFRFANERIFQFRMWQPENRSIRFERYWSYIRETRSRQQAVHVNGNTEWTDDQVKMLVSYLREQVPGFWARFCEIYHDVGFCDGAMMVEFDKHAAAVFTVPEDLRRSDIAGGVVVAADRLHHFEMMKPENRARASDLHCEWLNQSDLSFDEWRRRVRARRDGLSADASRNEDGDDGDLLTEEPGGTEFGDLVEELQARYPAAPREAIEGALRTSWKIGTSGWRCILAAEEELPGAYQWPSHLPE